MSLQTASSDAINWPLLDDLPPAYTAHPSPEEVMASDLLSPHILDTQLATHTSMNHGPIDLTAEQESPACDPPSAQEPTPHTHTDFHPDDYVADDDHIPTSILHHDNWLPDPPCASPKLRPVDFHTLHPNGNAVLTYQDSEGSLAKIDNLDLDIIQKRSPLIAAAFEASESGQHCLHLDALTPMSAKPFARYLYLGSYAEVNEEFEQIPSSLLLHSQLHYLGALFDITDLKFQALVNIIRQCEFACFSSDQPIDLCAALRFCYDNHPYCQKPIEHVIAYCITRFTAHKLGEDAAFRLLAYEHQHFRSDLARILLERNLADEAAIDLIRLPNALAESTEQPSIDALINPRSKVPIRSRSVNKEKRSAVLPSTNASPPPPLAGPSKIPLKTQNRQSMLTLALRGKHPAEDDLEPGDNAHEQHKRCKSVYDDFVLVSPLSESPTSSPLGAANDEAFVVLPGPTASEVLPRPNATDDNNSSNSSDDDLISFDSAETYASENIELQASSPRSDSSWVIT